MTTAPNLTRAGVATLAIAVASLAHARAPKPAPAAEPEMAASSIAQDPYGAVDRAKGGEATPKAKGYSPYAVPAAPAGGCAGRGREGLGTGRKEGGARARRALMSTTRPIWYTPGG
jgi:hypothetical protein